MIRPHNLIAYDIDSGCPAFNVYEIFKIVTQSQLRQIESNC
jgi:hypothetical protein